MFRTDSRRGFTFIEMMMVVAVMTSLAAVTLPAVMQGYSRQAARNAAVDVQGIIDFARTQASMSNVAHLIVPIIATGPAFTGQIEVWQGISSACQNFRTPDGVTGQQGIRIRVFDLHDQFPDVRMVSTHPANLPAVPLCFKPDGRVFQLNDDSTPQIIPAVIGSGMTGGTAAFRLRKFDDGGNAEGPTHSVIVPFNGISRKIIE